MLKLKPRIKKIVAIGIAALTLGLVTIQPAKSQSASEFYLAYITQFTYLTAQATYYIEEFTYGILAILNSWILPDKSDSTAALQASFVGVTNTQLENMTKQKDLQQQLTKDLTNPPPTDEVPPLSVNDFAYSTLLGNPIIKEERKDVDPSYNYIKNIAGINIHHRTPSDTWSGLPPDIINYQNFYTTVSAIQTYNAYILSQLYVDAKNKTPLTEQQNALMQQASNSDWFAQVASENIGIILRQILMYNSQIYVLLTQLLQTQKQLVAEQAMANTLLVVGNQFTESQLVGKATGTIKTR